MTGTPTFLKTSEVLASLSLAMDVGTGQPMGHGLRTCLLSVRLAHSLGLEREQVRSVHHVALLRFLGCTSDAAETAILAGSDDLAFNAAMAPVLNGSALETMAGLVSATGRGVPQPRRMRLLLGALTHPSEMSSALATHCEVASMLARRLGMGEEVVEALEHGYERWDGRGHPDGLAGEDVPMAIRVVTVARDALVIRRSTEDARSVMAERRGRSYAPDVVDALLGMGDWGVEADWDQVVEAEPTPRSSMADVDRALAVLADFADLKSPWTRGHSSTVAALAVGAAREAGLDEVEIRRLRRAGLVHDIGRVGVENGIWDKVGALATDEWERVRLHPYLTQRILSRCAALEPIGRLASSHHDRLDGSGYHRGEAGDTLSTAARLLAASDVLAASVAARPHRPALSPDDAASAMRSEVEAGRLDGRAVECVVAAAGGAARVEPPEPPAGLTDREVEVLRRICRGMTNREVGEELFISKKTVGRHVENIYAKTGVASRAAAAVFAMEHDLLG